ncbi:CAP domain-containing protein [Streptomyces sp. NPDC012421]|uniref:CAP domain-containing protein n=1 Tax=Streptomyces sp. NPDC012421 TaxID=3364832 RepID=UPI0036E6433A
MRYDDPDPSDPRDHPGPDPSAPLGHSRPDTPPPGAPTPGTPASRTPSPDAPDAPDAPETQYAQNAHDADEPGVPASAPSAPSPAPASGRHRRGGPVRRRALHRVLRRPSFPAAVLAAGTTAAAVTVLLGLYAATPSSSPAPRAAGPSAPGVRPPALPTPAPASPGARAEVHPDPATSPGDGPGRPDGGLAPQTGSVLAAPVGAPARASRFVQDVVALANAERDRAGCDPLRSEARLAKAAQGHADDMAARDYYAHASPEGRDGGDRITASGYTWSAWGENIHKGPKTPELAMDGWMESPAHRANIVNCGFRDIGVGVALTADGPWWVQDFGTEG